MEKSLGFKQNQNLNANSIESYTKEVPVQPFIFVNPPVVDKSTEVPESSNHLPSSSESVALKFQLESNTTSKEVDDKENEIEVSKADKHQSVERHL